MTPRAEEGHDLFYEHAHEIRREACCPAGAAVLLTTAAAAPIDES
jgi:hypothetical protein